MITLTEDVIFLVFKSLWKSCCCQKEHPSNADSPIVVTLFGIVIEVKEKHFQNAPFPIVVTLFGIVIDVKEEHSENA